MTGPNEQLRAAREALPSRQHPGLPTSREELAGRVAHWIEQHDPQGRPHPFDANHLGKLERGAVRRPGALVRAALCAVLCADEHDLGFSPHPSAQRVSAALNGCAPDSEGLEAVASVLASLRRLEDATGAAEVLPSVRSQAGLVSRLADNAHGVVRAQAVGLLSELEQYQGWLAIPLQRWGESRAHLDWAAVLAMEADDPLRMSTALSFAAYRSLRRDELRTADALSEAAARDDRVHAGLRTYITFQRAEVLARDGDHTEAVRALDRADELTERLPEDDLPSSGYWYVPAFFLGQRAFVLAALGETHAARRTAAESLAAMPESWRHSEWAHRRRALAE